MWLESMAINSVKKLIKALLYPWYEKRLLRKLDFSQTPHHIGIIVDGNRRWAKANTVATKSGHQAGANKISESYFGSNERYQGERCCGKYFCFRYFKIGRKNLCLNECQLWISRVAANHPPERFFIQ